MEKRSIIDVSLNILYNIRIQFPNGKVLHIMLIDFHTHAFADSLAPRAIASLSAASGGLTPSTDGTVAGLLHRMDADGVSHSVMLNIATKPKQQTRINDWAKEISSGRITAFGSVHPDAPDALEELERIKDLGLKGIKLHPEYQNFEVDDPRLFPIYKKAASLGLITVFHAGQDIGFMPPAKAAPDRLLRALSVFDGAPVVAAHFGGYIMWDEVLEKLCGLPVYFDTSFCFGRIQHPLAQAIVEKHTPDRILFGTDLPWSDAKTEKRLIDSLDLTDADKEKIFFRNAASLLQMNL